jgi:hypothetical protein
MNRFARVRGGKGALQMPDLALTHRTRRIPLAALAFVVMAFSSAAEPSDTKTASTPPAPPLSQQTFVVVQATGIKLAPNAAFDVNKPLTLTKGQMIVLKSSSGQLIEVMGPLNGKPINHYTPIVGNATMGYDPKSFGTHGHCSTDTSGTPHPSGGPNPDETAGSENSATHCAK